MCGLRALLLDLDGVLRIWSVESDRRAEEASGLPVGSIRRAAFSPELLWPALTGRVSDGQWRRAVAEKLQGGFPSADAERAVRLWSETDGSVDGAVLSLVRGCRRLARVVLVTNATSRLSQDLQRLRLAREFDAVIGSAAVGFMKPEAEIYAAALDVAGVAASEAVFVDDREENVAAATRIGMSGHVYRGVRGLREHLRRCGLGAAGDAFEQGD